MSQQEIQAGNTRENDRWLANLFASAPGPVIDAAFVARILNTLQRRSRFRLFVLFGTIGAAAVVTTWQLSGLGIALPSPNTDVMGLPDWLATPQTVMTATGVMIAAVLMWVVAEEV